MWGYSIHIPPLILSYYVRKGLMQMRTLNVTVSEGQFERLEDEKGDRTWRDAILQEFGVREEPETES